MSSNNLVKICPWCSFVNSVSDRRCGQCKKSLAGVVSQSDTQQMSTSSDEQLQVSDAVNDPINQPGEQLIGVRAELPSTAPSQTSNIVEEPPGPQRNTPDVGTFPVTPPPDRNFTIKTTPKRKRALLAILVAALITLIVLVPVLFPHLSFGPTNGRNHSGTKGSTTTASATLPPALNGLGEFKAANGQLLGVNDGSFSPFIGGDDASLKQQAANQIQQGQSSQAIALLQTALKRINNDAEAWIYLENQRVLLSGLPYMTLIAATDLFESTGSGLSDLQGIYVAQHEFNDSNYGFQIRILIANSGTNIDNVTPIAHQIVNIANQDKTVVGVISWLTSAENITALPILSGAHIPMISPAASSDLLTNASPYFLRIIATNQIEGKASALFAEQTLHAHTVVVFVDNSDPYSQNLTQDFENQFKQDGNTVLKEEPFSTENTSKAGTLIQDALKTHPDLLYFTSRYKDDMTNFQDALPTSGPFAHIPALAGDAGYVAHRSGYGRWYFASAAFAGAVNSISSISQPFYQDYSADFNQDRLKPAGYYGYTRPDNYSMLSYDVTSVFLSGIQTVIAKNKLAVTSIGLQQVTPALLAATLPGITLQGVSGWIAFDSNHNPINKAIVFLTISLNGDIQMKDWQGCFTQSLCRNVS